MATERELGYDITDVLGVPDLFGADNLLPESQNQVGNSLLFGGITRTSTAFGKVATVKAGENITPALEALKAAGGGTLVLLRGTHLIREEINGFSNLRIIGEGRDLTILDFQDSIDGLKFVGTSGDPITNVEISDLTVKRGDYSTPRYTNIYFYNVENFLLRNVKSEDPESAGGCMEIWASREGELNNCYFETASGGNGDAVYITGRSADGYCQNISFINCHATMGGSGVGFYISGSGNVYAILNIQFIGCTVIGNGTQGYGFYVSGSTSPVVEMHVMFLNCQASQLDIGFYAAGDPAYLTYIGCHAYDNDINGFYQDGQRVSMIGCMANGNGDRGLVTWDPYVAVIGCQSHNNDSLSNAIQITGNYSAAVGNISDGDMSFYVEHSAAVGNVNIPQTPATDVPETKILSVDLVGEFTTVDVNTGDAMKTRKRTLIMYNASGSALAAGDVVVYSNSSTAYRCTTTTTQGNDLVAAMALEAIPAGEQGRFLVEGYTALLKVDGTTDIAAGDFIGTSGTAGIGMKAASGDMAFAIAFEGYTTDDTNGVINAILIPPRKI